MRTITFTNQDGDRWGIGYAPEIRKQWFLFREDKDADGHVSNTIAAYFRSPDEAELFRAWIVAASQEPQP